MRKIVVTPSPSLSRACQPACACPRAQRVGGVLARAGGVPPLPAGPRAERDVHLLTSPHFSLFSLRRMASVEITDDVVVKAIEAIKLIGFRAKKINSSNADVATEACLLCSHILKKEVLVDRISAHVEKVHSVTPKYTCDKCNFYISELTTILTLLLLCTRRTNFEFNLN